MKKGSLIILCIMLTVSASGKVSGEWSRFTYGVEWSYIGVFYSGYHYNFFAPEGYRVDPRRYGFVYDTNGEALFHAGYEIDEKWNISLYTGISAFEDQHLTVPISIRLSRYFKARNQGGQWLGFIDSGSGFSIKAKPQEIYAGKVGGGYRMHLSARTKLDFVASLRISYTHADIYYDGTKIPFEKINRNNAYNSGLTIGMALTF